jgi:hypothetical protein
VSAPGPTILETMEDPALFGPWFTPVASWRPWQAVLAGLFGLPMAEGLFALYRQLTGRRTAPTTPAREGWFVVGRRGGKSRIMALIAVYLACFRDYRAILAPGEKGTVMLLAADRRQARVLMRYVTGMLDGVPMLAQLIVARTAESVTLSTGIVIEIHTSNFRAVRGYTCVAALLDEVAFWPTGDESANPDHEVLTALLPAMATVPDALLVGASSPYARRGLVFEKHRGHFGKDGDPGEHDDGHGDRARGRVPTGHAGRVGAHRDDVAGARPPPRQGPVGGRARGTREGPPGRRSRRRRARRRRPRDGGLEGRAAGPPAGDARLVVASEVPHRR